MRGKLALLTLKILFQRSFENSLTIWLRIKKEILKNKSKGSKNWISFTNNTSDDFEDFQDFQNLLFDFFEVLLILFLPFNLMKY